MDNEPRTPWGFRPSDRPRRASLGIPVIGVRVGPGSGTTLPRALAFIAVMGLVALALAIFG